MLFSVSSHLSPKKSPPLLQLNFKFRTKLKKASLNFPSKNAEQHYISRKTKCSTFAKHFVPKSHLLTQFKM